MFWAVNLNTMAHLYIQFSLIKVISVKKNNHRHFAMGDIVHSDERDTRIREKEKQYDDTCVQAEQIFDSSTVNRSKRNHGEHAYGP